MGLLLGSREHRNEKGFSSPTVQLCDSQAVPVYSMPVRCVKPDRVVSIRQFLYMLANMRDVGSFHDVNHEDDRRHRYVPKNYWWSEVL